MSIKIDNSLGIRIYVDDHTISIYKLLKFQRLRKLLRLKTKIIVGYEPIIPKGQILIFNGSQYFMDSRTHNIMKKFMKAPLTGTHYIS